MDERPRFCSSCGSPLGAGARFCPACGQSLADTGPVEGGPTDTGAAAPTGAGPAGPPPSAPTPATPTHTVPVPTTPPPPGPAGPAPIATPPPPTIPPPGPAGTPAGGGPERRRTALILGALAAAVALLIVLLVVVSGGDGRERASTDDPDETDEPVDTDDTDDADAATGEILLEPVGEPIEDPFTDSVGSVAETAPSVPLPTIPVATTSTSLPAGAVPLAQVAGSRPGLYGGTRQERVCDKDQLVSFLQANPDKAAAWAGVQGIRTEDIPAFVADLTPLVLTRDTRVTNHGFKNGRARAHQSVLQAGSAVLVDRTGMPRAKCSCGNPLAPPAAVRGTPTYTGPQWPGFDPMTIVVVVVDVEVEGFVLVDLAGGPPFVRPAGTDGSAGTDTEVAVDALCDLFPDDPACTVPETTLPTSDVPPEQLPVLVQVGNIGGVQNGPSAAPSFTVTGPTFIGYIGTYHWNDGQGASPGTLALQAADGTVYGPWSASTLPGQGGVPNAYWYAYPNVVVPAGSYTVVDSDPATWAHNAESGNVGFGEVRGVPSDGSSPPPAPEPTAAPGMDQATLEALAFEVVDGVLDACGIDVLELTSMGPGSVEDTWIVEAQTTAGLLVYLVDSGGFMQPQDQLSAEIAVECGFYQP